MVAEERHIVSGLGGSQKAEVAWLDKHGILYKEVDVCARFNRRGLCCDTSGEEALVEEWTEGKGPSYT
jgi:hypothetical protein